MMLNAKYTPRQDNLIQFKNIVVEKQFAAHRAELDHDNAEVVKIGASVSELSQAIVAHDDQIGKLKLALTKWGTTSTS